MVFYVIFCLFLLFSKGNSLEKIKGVNIGGLLVLEPWITPSLFYPFLGKNKNKNTNSNSNSNSNSNININININKVGMDMYTFCEVLGPTKANEVLRNHWSTWFTENHIQILSKNNINVLRVPIGDWMYIPYGPFSTLENGVKCTDGDIEILDNLFVLAKKYNMKILLDLHGVKGSQNGFDNSGQTLDVQIVNKNDNDNDTIHFKHWEIRAANWIGPFDLNSKSYPLLDMDSINHSKMVLLHIIRKYYNYPGLYGLCVLNEPWEFTPEDFLKGFYQDIFNMFTEYMSQDKVFVIHDSFRSTIWENFELSDNTKNITILIDTHQYTAWNNPYSSYENLIQSACGWQAPRLKYRYVIGEWSLAIDNCEMWLNGFMDNVPGYPLFECSYNPCPKNKQFASELSQSEFGPFGTGESYPRKNSHTKQYDCPVSIPLSKHFSNLEEEDEIQKEEKVIAEQLFLSKTRAFEKETAGWIFWNFRTESSSYQWDYLAYLELTNQGETENTNTKMNEYSNKNNYYPISIYICSVIFFLGVCIYFIYLYKSFINLNLNTNTTKKNGYTIIGSNQFENKNYQSISV